MILGRNATQTGMSTRLSRTDVLEEYLTPCLDFGALMSSSYRRHEPVVWDGLDFSQPSAVPIF
eukprot:7939946-Lingulodinium_polyedra.AAC.1